MILKTRTSRRNRINTFLFAGVITVIFSVGLTSCSTLVVRTGKAQGDQVVPYGNEIKVKRWFWGKVANGAVKIDTCDSQALVRVEVRPGFGNTLISFLTLGVYCPTRVRWVCFTMPAPDPCPECPGTSSSTDSSRRTQSPTAHGN